jgi:hypothetical protein
MFTCCLRPQISGQEEKKRESIMVVANQTKSRLQLAEDALHRVQVRWWWVGLGGACECQPWPVNLEV